MGHLGESKISLPRTARNERGISLVFFALSLPVVIALLGLVLGGGLLIVNKARLSDIAEMAAFSALKAYQSSTLPTYDERADEALAEVNLILSVNPMPNSSRVLEPIGRVTPTQGGRLALGQIIREAPANTTPPPSCGGSYPCFIPYNPAQPGPVNAAEIELRTGGLGAIRVPFVDRLMTVGAKLVATTLNTATIVVVDTSLSMGADSHGYNGGLTPSRPLYPASMLSASCPSTGDPILESWCALGPSRTTFVTFNPRIHFKNDYKQTGNYLVDSYFDISAGYVGPEPLTTALTLANLALRKSAGNSFPGDTWRLIAARGQTPAILPPLSEPGLSRPDYLIQLTNFDNRGLYDANQTLLRPYPHPVHPNAIDKGLLSDPTIGADQTPLTASIRTAITDFSGVRSGMRKHLIVISDGAGNCSQNLGCVDSIEGYTAAESELLALLPDLIGAGIDVTIVPLGASMEPHILNILDPLNPGSELGPNFLTPEAAADHNYNGVGSGALLFESAATADLDYQSWCQLPQSGCTGCNRACTERYAYLNRGKPGVAFRRPMAALGDLALGLMRAKLGKLCLIQPPGPDAAYVDYDGNANTPPTFNPNLRIVDKPQLNSLIGGERGQQLLECLGSRPQNIGMEVVLRE